MELSQLQELSQQPQPFAQSGKQKFKRREIKYSSIYSQSLLTRSITLPVTYIGNNLKQTIEKDIAFNFEGKCVAEGYIKSGSSKIISYSSGVVKASDIIFEVVFECLVCCPVEGMLIQCEAKNITKAGIRAESSEETPSPVVVFITRDHHYASEQFSEIKDGDRFVARVIGQRFELNDKYVSIIAELVEKKDYEVKPKAKPRIVIKG
jgi:DNA-directed RNA polymerase subunit E'/Rpb7